MRLTGLVFTLLFCTAAIAQENSPYSRYGLGDITPSQNITNRAMGGISAGFSDYKTVNFVNPASYGSLSLATFDFGAEIDICLKDISEKTPTGFPAKHFARGTIWYPGDPDDKPSGIITYVKPVLCGDEFVDVCEYSIENKKFPQQSTGDQFFDESQFESYRKLGYCSLLTDEDKKKAACH